MKKTKILILGSTGMLGHQVVNLLIESKEFEIVDVVYRTKLREESILCDVTNQIEVSDIISHHKPDYIVNCVGVLIKGSVNNPSNAIFINSYFPHFLKWEADKIGCRVIHISTDCVFSGKRGRYKECDFRDADDIYGRTKALGEIDDTGHLTIRTSIVGPELKQSGEGLYHWFINQKGIISGFTRAIWGGVTTIECAKAIRYAILNQIGGVVNLTNGNGISKYDMLRLFSISLSKKDVVIEINGDYVIDKSLISERTDFKYLVPTYDVMFQEMANYVFENKSIYKHYDL